MPKNPACTILFRSTFTREIELCWFKNILLLRFSITFTNSHSQICMTLYQNNRFEQQDNQVLFKAHTFHLFTKKQQRVVLVCNQSRGFVCRNLLLYTSTIRIKSEIYILQDQPFVAYICTSCIQSRLYNEQCHLTNCHVTMVATVFSVLVCILSQYYSILQ